MGEGSNTLQQGAVQPLCDAIESWSVMRGKLSGCSCGCEMSIKRAAQVLSTAVRTQDLDTLAVILGYCPRLKGFVRLERLVFGAQEKGESIAGRVIREGDEVLAALLGKNMRRPPDIGVDFIAEVLGGRGDPS
jgi:hypothetical protein